LNILVKNISYLSFGQAIKIALRFFAFSYITKSLTPHQYGQFLTVISFCEFFQMFTLPGLSKPLVRSALREIDRIDTILSSKSGLRNLLAFIAIMIVNISVSFMNYDDSVVSLIRFYSIILLIDSLRTYIRIVFNCFEAFKWISFSEIIQSVSYVILIMISINTNIGVKGIVFASVLSTIFSFIADYLNSRRYSKFDLFGGFEIDKVFIASAFIFTLTNIMWIIITKIDILMLSMLTSSEDVALFGVANRIIFFCIMGISIVSKVLFPPLVKALKVGRLNIKKHINKIFGTYIIIFVGCLILRLYSELIITTIAGNKYIASAEILDILLLYLIIQTFSTPLKLILYALEKEKILFMIILPLPIIKIILNKFLYNSLGVHGIAYATVSVFALYLLSLIIVNRKLFKEIILN
jgi:O-antigen/teichoic acid export membrane protein